MLAMRLLKDQLLRNMHEMTISKTTEIYKKRGYYTFRRCSASGRVGFFKYLGSGSGEGEEGILVKSHTAVLRSN